MLLMGEETPYVMTKPGAQEGYIYLFYSPLYADWRDLGVFAADSITLKSVSVTYPAADSSFTLSRKAPNAPWLVDGMPGSTENIRHYLKGFEGKVNAESLGDTRYPGLLDSLKQKQPDVRLTVENFSGPPVSLILYIRGDDLHNYFGWVDGKNELLTFQEFILGRFLVKKSDLNPH